MCVVFVKHTYNLTLFQFVLFCKLTEEGRIDTIYLLNEILGVVSFIFVPSARRAQGTMLSSIRVRP